MKVLLSSKRSFLGLLLVWFASASLLSAQATNPTDTRKRTEAWPEDVLRAAGSIAVQDGGRIKPLSSMAGFMMLSINGKQTFKTEWGEKLDPVAWFLDCIFFRDQAMDYRMIRLVDYRIVESIGLSRKSNKRSDHYSMREILPASQKLQEQSSLYSRKDSKQRSALESQILELGHNMRRLLFLTSFLDFARADFDLSDMPELEASFPDVDFISGLDMLRQLEEVRAKVMTSGVDPSTGINEALGETQRQMDAAGFVRFIPPSRLEDETYYSPMDVMEIALVEGTAMPVELGLVDRLPQLMNDRLDMAKLGAGIISLQAELQTLAEKRGEFAKVKEEVQYYEHDWFFRSLIAFWLGFLLCMGSWFFKRGGMLWKGVYAGGWLMVLLAEGLLISGIVARCLLKDRPPVTTVYEAILFIFAAIVFICLFMEWIKRNSLALSTAALTGALGMHLGMWNVDTDGTDTIAPLVAVLDTNFWLSIHVPTITLGYAAGLLAAFLGHIFVCAKAWDVIRRNAGAKGVSKGFFGDLTKMTYGVLCFGALTATVGTILGGVWANDSWGRFWGWDPKENGALMLCLGFIAILHGRMGGYLRQFGIALSSILLGIVVLWAFWGVNLLQVGFHSYGFDATKARILFLYKWTELSVVAFGLVIWALDRALSKRKLAH